MKRRFIAVVLSFLLIITCVSAVACGSVGSGNDNNGEEIIVWWPSSGVGLREIVDDAIERYTEENPNFRCKVVSKPMDSYQNLAYVMNDDATRPDIAILDHVYVAAMANDDLILNLTGYMDNTWKSKYVEDMLDGCTFKGDLYALPFTANTVSLAYNKNILAEAGVTEIPTTFDGLVEACEKVTAIGKTAFSQFSDTTMDMVFASYVSRNGGTLVSADSTQILFDTQPVKDALKDWIKLSTFTSNTLASEEGRFQSGEIAFMEYGSWGLSAIDADWLGITEVVTIDPNLPNYSGLGLYSLVIPTPSRNNKMAVEFAKFLSTDTKTQVDFNKVKNLFPVTKTALEDKYFTDNEYLRVYASQLTKVTARPASAAWPEIEEYLMNMIKEVVSDSKNNLGANFDALVNSYQERAQAATDRVMN